MIYDDLSVIAQSEFADTVTRVEPLGRRANTPLKLRLHLRDTTYIDVWFNPVGNEYAFHWECRAVRGLLFRHDNAPDHPEISTHHKHFHNGSEANIEASNLPDDPSAALREFLSFVKEKLAEFKV